MQKEFGVSASKSSLARFYRHLVKNRAMDEMSEIMEAAEEVNGLAGEAGEHASIGLES